MYCCWWLSFISLELLGSQFHAFEVFINLFACLFQLAYSFLIIFFNTMCLYKHNNVCYITKFYPLFFLIAKHFFSSYSFSLRIASFIPFHFFQTVYIPVFRFSLYECLAFFFNTKNVNFSIPVACHVFHSYRPFYL